MQDHTFSLMGDGWGATQINANYQRPRNHHEPVITALARYHLPLKIVNLHRLRCLKIIA